MWDVGVAVAAILTSGLVLALSARASTSGTGTPFRPWVRRLDWRVATALLVIVFGIGATLQLAPVPCGSGEDDVGAYLASGVAARTGGNPFWVPSCGGAIPVPYGFAGVALNTMASFLGRAGVWAMWLVPALSIPFLVWKVAPTPNRRAVLYFVSSSAIFAPVVAAQIDGASNAIGPVAILLSLVLAGRSEKLAGLAGGFLATVRFPLVVPTLGTARTESAVRPWILAATTASFAGLTVLAYGLWGSRFLETVILGQLGRTDFSLNEFALLTRSGWLPAPELLLSIQAIILVLTLVYVLGTRRPAAASVSILLIVLVLVIQFLSFNFLIWLLPVALVSHRARVWLWLVGVVAAFDYGIAYAFWALGEGVWWPYELSGVALSAVLLGLLRTLVRSDPPLVAGKATTSS